MSSIFKLFVVLTSIVLFGAGTHWMVDRRLGELDGTLLLTGFAA